MKICEYCRLDYQEKRSDQKYCGTRCKNKASLERRAIRNPNQNIAPAISKPVTDSSSQRIMIDQNQLKILIEKALNPNDERTRYGRHDSTLLAEKDLNRDLSSELSEYRIKLYFLEEKLKEKDEIIKDLKEDLRDLGSMVNQQDMGFIEKLIENNPTLVPMCIEKITPIIANKASTDKSSQIDSDANKTSTDSPANIGSDSKKKQMSELRKSIPPEDVTEEFVQEYKQSIKNSIEELDRLYPDYRVDDVLELLVKSVKENKSFIDNMLFPKSIKEN